ncbi:hypothetical protein [Flavobacterium sp.]|uniref:hypothetical protein n=1 Tax=Flavobacterium sp. TaxID=239 RepID=UPI002ED9D8DC
MPLQHKIVELMSKKYNTNITVMGNYESSNYTSILDNDNGTILVVSNSDQFSFKDQDRNLWLTVVESFHADGKQHFPKIGESYTVNNGVKYNFTTKEAIVDMAVKYFDKHRHNNA